MNTILKKWLTKAAIAAITLMMIAQPALASSTRDNDSDVALRFQYIDIDNGTFDPRSNEEAKIEFTINKNAYITFEIFDKDDNLVVTVEDDEWYRKGKHSLKWYGESRDGTFVNQGEYEYKLTAKINGERETYEGALVVERNYTASISTTRPQIRDFYVTKDEFDPSLESTYLVFDLTANADISVEIYDADGNFVEQIYSQDNRPAGNYKIKWDGDKVVNDEGKFVYKVRVENSQGHDLESGTVEIEEYDNDSNGPNVYNDQADISELPYRPENNLLAFTFKIDKGAEVTLDIKEGNRIIKRVANARNTQIGMNTIVWDGLDTDGVHVDEGIYEYKLTAKNGNGKTVETGYFSVLESSELNGGKTCGGFTDVRNVNMYCDAIQWARGEGIFEGYSDGSFRPNTTITRVEALKVIFETIGIRTLRSYGENLGFTDLNAYEWYNPYIKTALSLGVVNGYGNGIFRPENTVTRAEGLKMLLETAKVADGVIVPIRVAESPYLDTPAYEWYASYVSLAEEFELWEDSRYFYPDRGMTRAEMADLLYRYENSNL